MSAVKGHGLRAEQASATRRRIVDAAARVFVASGYGATRIEDVAVEAGVAVPTVYKGFTNKRNLLIAAVDAAMTGRDDGHLIEEQAWWQEQLDEPDPQRQLRLIARNARRIYERAGGILDVVRDAARVDADIAAVWADVTDRRMTRSRRTAKDLAKKTRTSRDAAFTLWSLTSPELYTCHLAAGRTASQYERWLGNLLTAALLP